MPFASNQPGVLLPTLPNCEPLPEVVLFAFDDGAFPFYRNMRLHLIAGQQPRLVLRHGAEGAHDEVLLYAGSVARIGDRFHLWYNGNYGPLGNEITYERTNCCVCYASSPDGINWEKPNLGLVEFNGNKQNNIVDLPAPTLWASAAVLFDPEDAAGGRRYKMAYQAWVGGELQFCTAFSSDGRRWRPAALNPVGPAFAVSGVIRYRGRYYACGQVPGDGRLMTLASADFEHWSPCAAPGLDRGGEAEQVHLGAGLWNRGNVVLAVYGQWHGHPTGDRRLAAIDLGLAISHDAVHYREPIPGFRLIPAREQPHSPIGFMPALMQGQGMENHEDHALYWYALWRGAHGSGVRLVSWTRDRLGALQPSQPWDAQVISCPFEIVTGRARAALNVSGLGDSARLRVSLLDEGFRPIPRYSGADAAIVTDTGLRVPLRWGGGDLLLPSHGLLRLAINFEGLRLEDARLYAAYIGE